MATPRSRTPSTGRATRTSKTSDTTKAPRRPRKKEEADSAAESASAADVTADDDFGSGVDLDLDSPPVPTKRAPVESESAHEAVEEPKKKPRGRPKAVKAAEKPVEEDDFGAELDVAPSYTPSRETYHTEEPEQAADSDESEDDKPRRVRSRRKTGEAPVARPVEAPVARSRPPVAEHHDEDTSDDSDEDDGPDGESSTTESALNPDGTKKRRRRRRKKGKIAGAAPTEGGAPAPPAGGTPPGMPPKRPFERRPVDRGGYQGSAPRSNYTSDRGGSDRPNERPNERPSERPSGDRPSGGYPSAYQQRTGGGGYEGRNSGGYQGGRSSYEQRSGGYENRNADRGGGDRSSGNSYEQRSSEGNYEQQPRSNEGGGGYEGRSSGGYDNYRGGEYRTQPNRFDRFRTRGPTGKSERNAPKIDTTAIEGTYSGVLELHPKGYGFLRDAENDYASREIDPFVSSQFVERHRLREGIVITGEVGPGSRGQGPRLNSIAAIDGQAVEHYEALKHFDTMTPVNPYEHIKLETGPTPMTMRVMDLLTPIGKGQRALIVAPPRTGKTMLLAEIADSVTKNHPEIHLIMLLIDERPEEVTDMRRKVKGEVIASSMDRDVESHVRISQLIFERGKRLAEQGKDVFILMDSVTRAARAFNKWVTNTGRGRGIMSGGLDVKALDIPKKMFGTARRFEEGGSLTVVATALIDTNSKMDEVIFQEFKGTGNMELVLSRELADRRIWPSIDITKSGTRREEKILPAESLEGIVMLRRALIAMSPVDAMNELTRKLAMFKTNKEFLERVRSIL